ncbi:MAG: peptidylprolyl isomerase [Chloroflexota bacterium]
MRTLSGMMAVALLAAGFASHAQADTKPAAAAAAPAVSSAPARASDTQVLTTVNGSPITEDMVRSFARAKSGGKDIDLTPEQEAGVIKALTNIEILAQQARSAGIDSRREMQTELHLSADSILAQAFVQDYLKQHQPSDADIQAAYDERVKSVDTHQYKARHILVKDEATAKGIIAQLNKGASFAALAKKDSIDKGSAEHGGDLGDWFSGSAMVPEFSAALATLKKGQYTKTPVQTQYGWHVIQLEDSRTQDRPTLAQMHDQISNELMRKTMTDYLNQLVSSAKIVSAPAAATSH